MKEHRIGFRGSLLFSEDGDDVLSPDSLGLVDAGLETTLSANGHVSLVVNGRPDTLIVEELAGHARASEPSAIFAAGSGAVLDAAKLAAHRAGHAGELVLIPCGDEPWRAFAPFSVVDHDGERPTLGDATGGTARVVVIGDLLGGVEDRVVAIAALDTAVHAIESLLSVRGQPYSEALASAALRLVAGALDDALAPSPPDRQRRARVRLVVAAGLAVEAFLMTSLGLAHAVASPLGTRLGVTHDTLNGVLGRAAIDFWADVAAIQTVAAALGVPADAAEVLGVLDRFLAHAGLPRTLRDLDIVWDDVEAVLPIAARSSGLPGSPRPVSAADLRAFARAAWDGGVTDEPEETTWTHRT